MRNKWALRAISWILSIIMIVSSVGMDSLTVHAAEASSAGQEILVADEADAGVGENAPGENLPVVEAEVPSVSGNIPVTETEESGTEDVQPVAGEEVSALSLQGDGFTYSVDFTTGYNTAEMVFTLEKIGDAAPSGSNNLDLYIKVSGVDEEFQQFGWYQGLSNDTNQITVSDIKYRYEALTPGVSYDIKIALRHDNNIIGEAITSFETKAIEITPVEEKITWFSSEHSFIIADKDALVEAGIEKLQVWPYIQEKGGTLSQAQTGGDGLDLMKDNLRLTGLKDDTEYTIYMSGIRNGAQPSMFQMNFKTIKDTRKLTLSEPEIQYCYANFFTKVSGGRDDVLTVAYLFLREKGAEQWRVNRMGYMAEAFSQELRMNELNPCTEYEYVVGIYDNWDLNNPDVITKEGHKISGTFTTPEDPRELSAVSSAGYQTALIQTSYTENNLSGVQCVIHAFVREVGTTEWVEQRDASYDSGNTFDLIFKDLKQDTEYEYRIILNSKWDGTTAEDEVHPRQLEEGTFKTALCEYTLSLTPDEEKSLYNREYLNVQLNGSDRDRAVSLAMVFDNDAEKQLFLYRDEKYADTFSLRDLSSDTTYHLTEYELWVKEFGLDVCIAHVECEDTDYTFTTPKAVAPTTVELQAEEFYLNAAQPDEENVGYVVLKPTVDDGASNEMIWSVEDSNIATVDEDGKVVAVSVGTTTVTATSKYDEMISVTVPVYVGEFAVFYAEDDREIGDDILTGLKGTQSPELYVMGRAYDEEESAEVTVTGYSGVRATVASFDAESGQITFGTVGTTKLYLEKDEYKVRLNVESYVKTAAYYVDSVSNDNYPGVETEENTYVLVTGQEYQIDLKAINGEEIGSADDFVVTMEPDPNESITLEELKVTTSDTATTTPIKLTISPKEGSAYDNMYYTDAVIYLIVRDLPAENEPGIQVYTNVSKYLSDVKLEDGWKWENENVPLYALRNTQDYDFDAYYEGDDKYPARQTIRISLAEIRNFNIEDVSKTNGIVTADGEDKITLKVQFDYVGRIDFNDLSKELLADSADCTIECKRFDNTSAVYEVSATKAGSYTLTAKLNSAAYGAEVVSDSFVVTATDTALVRSIKVKDTATDTFLEDDELLLDSTLDMKRTIDLMAVTYDYKDTPVDAPELVWSTTDKTVVTITPASKKDTQNAKLVVKGEGNAIITVQSKDDAGIKYSFVVEVKQIAPRVDATKITINTALDYDINEGREIAYKYNGFVEVVEAYDNEIETWTFYKKTKRTFEQEPQLQGTDFKFYSRYGVGNKQDILIAPVASDMKKGKYELWLAITTKASDTVYTYPVTVNVVNTPMKVRATSDNVNTFYMLDENADIAYTFTGNYIYNPVVHWEDNTDEAIGFDVNKYIYYNNTKKKWCSHVGTTDLEMAGKKPANGTDSGKLVFTFRGYREPVEIKNFKIKNTYKVPNITTVDAKTTVSVGCGITKAAFYLYQKDAKSRIQFHDGASKYYYSTYKSNIEEVNVYPTSDYSDYMEYEYSGNNKTEKLVITLRSDYWREKVEVKHTINNVDPALVLEKSQMTFNWSLPGVDTSVLKVKNAQHGAFLKDVIITGKGKDAQDLIDDNVFTFTLDENKYLNVKLNHLESMNKKYKDTTYTFNVVPVFVNAVTGKEVTGKACTLKVKTTSKAAAVTVSASGGIDLAKFSMRESEDFYKNAVKLNFKFANLNSNYEVLSREVIGDYAKYFEIWWSDKGKGFYLVPKWGTEGKLKAGFTYNIQFKCTLKMKDGVTTEVVTAKPYKLKLKQSTVAVKITPNSQIMYLSNEEVTRTYGLKVNNDCYRIDSITGSLDVNKDGKADFIIDSVRKDNGDTEAYVTIRLTDRDAVSGTARGKQYKVPVEVMLRGADGVNKNVKTSITVVVKK